LVALVVVLPWGVIINHRAPDYWHYFFWVEHIKRFMSNRPQHPEPFYFFLPLLFLGGLPWTVFIPAALLGLKERFCKDSLLRFSCCWLIFPFLFFSASRGKLGTYILPCFQPLAILITVGLLHYLKKKTKWVTFGASFCAAVTGLCAFGLLLSAVLTVPLSWKLFGQGEIWKLALVFLAVVSWALFSGVAVIASGFKQKMAWLCLGPLLFMFSSQFAMPDRYKNAHTPGEFLLRHADRIRPDTTLVSDNYLVSAVCWFYKRSDVCLLGNPGELKYGVSRAPEKNRLITLERFRELVAQPSRRITLITSNKRYEKYKLQIPKPAFLVSDSGLVFAQFYEDPKENNNN
jgi:4-amino-4-deoxy-L-arabinose transferase